MLDEILHSFDPLCDDKPQENGPISGSNQQQSNELISELAAVFNPKLQVASGVKRPENASRSFSLPGSADGNEKSSDNLIGRQMNDLYASDNSSQSSSCANSPDENVAPTSIFSNILNVRANEVNEDSSTILLNQNARTGALGGFDLFEADQLRKRSSSRDDNRNFADLLKEFDTLKLTTDTNATSTVICESASIGETSSMESSSQQQSDQDNCAVASCSNLFSRIRLEESRESSSNAEDSPRDKALKELFDAINLNLACNSKTESFPTADDNGRDETSSSENRKVKRGRQIPIIKNVLPDNTVVCTYDESEISVGNCIVPAESLNSGPSGSAQNAGVASISAERAPAIVATDFNENRLQLNDRSNDFSILEHTASPENSSTHLENSQIAQKVVSCPDLQNDLKFEEPIIETYGVDCYVDYIKYVDTHCHLDLLFDRVKFEGSFAEFKKLYSNTWSKFYFGCITSYCFPNSFQEKRAFFDNILQNSDVKATIGCHPHQADKYNNVVEDFVFSKLSDDKFVAIGECGLDYSSKNCVDHALQMSVLQRQLRLATAFNKPIVLHCRMADGDLLKILKKIVPHNHPMHLHSFTGDVATYLQYADYFTRLYFGVTPAACSPRNNLLNEFIDVAPIDRLIIETDAPYFLPEKYKMNQFRPNGLQASHPGLGSLVAQKIAEIRCLPVDATLDQLFRNTQILYDSFY